MRQTASTTRRVCAGSAGDHPEAASSANVGLRSGLHRALGGGAPLGFSLHVLVVLVELGDFGDATYLEFDAGAERTAARPLRGFLLAGGLNDPETREQLLRLRVRAVGNGGWLAGE